MSMRNSVLNIYVAVVPVTIVNGPEPEYLGRDVELF